MTASSVAMKNSGRMRKDGNSGNTSITELDTGRTYVK
jgi:hypothetical protein